jgi:hypothetical protein
MLEGWITDSEKTIAAMVPPPLSPSSSSGKQLTFVKCFIFNHYDVGSVPILIE